MRTLPPLVLALVLSLAGCGATAGGTPTDGAAGGGPSDAAPPDLGSVVDLSPPPDLEPARATMYVDGTELRDRCGERVVLRGVNAGIAFPVDPTAASHREIEKTGANAVRLTFRVMYNNSSARDVDVALTEARSRHLIPIPALWDATGDFGKLGFCVDYWTAPAMVEVLRRHEAYTLLNLANEAGDGSVTEAQFKAGYLDAIARVRATGLKLPLVIDPAGYGRKEALLFATANELLAADPEHNLVFSWHPWDPNQAPARYTAAFDQARALGITFVVGEVAQQEFGFEPPGTRPIDYKALLELARQRDIGWLWWWWYADKDTHSLTTNGTFGSWANVGEEVCVKAPYGIAATARRTRYMTTGACQ